MSTVIFPAVFFLFMFLTLALVLGSGDRRRDREHRELMDALDELRERRKGVPAWKWHELDGDR
jgi:hypothetical protein